MEFFANAEKIGEDVAAPFSITWSNVTEGQYTITAVATDNTGGSVTSSPVGIILNDPNPPVLISAAGLTNEVTIRFSKRMGDSATNRFNYTLNNGATVQAARFDNSRNTVILGTSFLTLGQTYTLTVNGVSDLTGLPLAANTQATFTIQNFSSADVGSPAIAGLTTPSGNGYNIRGGGYGIGGTNNLSDQFHFNYVQRSGDFDLKVRVQAMTLADALSKAGLMARETLAANSRYAAVFATPSGGGCLFQARSVSPGATTSSGSFPVNYPDTWIRLKRAGNTFTGYASLDGNNWSQLGTVTIATMPANLFVGYVVSGQNQAQAVTAQFRDFQDVVGGTIGTVNLPFEPPGPSRRTTPIAITEIFYKPASSSAPKVLDFIELYNSNPHFEDISGYRLSGDISYVFPQGTIMQGGQFLVVAASPGDVQSTYGITGVLGPWGNTNNPGSSNLTTSGSIRLRNDRDDVLLIVEYSNEPPWPVGADGTGHSLVLARPSHGENNPAAWAISDKLGGSPGRVDGYTFAPQRNVVINEFLANSDGAEIDYIELYNHSRQAVDLSGCGLSDEKGINKYVFPPGTIIGSNGFIVVYQTSLNFGLSSGGETLYFWNSNRTRLLDAVTYAAQGANISSGRWPNGSLDFYPLQTRTPGAANSSILVHDIVINELMYKPISGDEDDEYVELYNKGTNAVDLGGWRFVAGIDFTFPPNTILGTNAYLVVAKDANRLMTNYAHLNPGNTIGDYDQSLANGGERVALARPDISYTTNDIGEVFASTVYVVVDEVTYDNGGNYWPLWSDEGGSSMELIDPRSNHRMGYNWAESDEAAKAPWTTVEATGPMDLGAGTANLIEILAMGEGEYMVDNVEVFTNPATNLLTPANSTFNSGLGSWQNRGTHSRSSYSPTGGEDGSGGLHVRASDRGDSIANRNVCVLNSIPSGVLTIRAQVRWLKGWPEILFRIHGNYMEAYGRLNIPANLGTPGQRNSRAATNAAPAIAEVSHTPVVPADNEPVVVTAKIHDPDGFSGLSMRYRIDPSATYTTVAMVDNGTGGDSVANDGIYSATILGQPAGTLAAFQVIATDTRGASSMFPVQIPTWPAAFECHVRFGDPTPYGAFGTYRMWITAANINAWSGRPALSNERIYGTFGYGTFRAVYNMHVKWNGSPYHQFGGAPTSDGHYTVDLPEDDKILGTESFHKIHHPGNGPGDDATQQREQIGYWLARKIGLPYNYRRNVNMIFNGARRGGTTLMMEDTETPGNDVIESRFPDDPDGQLFKLQPWFEVDDGTARSLGFANQSWTLFTKFLSTSNGVSTYKTARYRNNFLTRAAKGTANNYNPVFNLIDILSIPSASPAYTKAVEELVDVDEWTRIWAVCHAVGDWDHVGTANAQNMYAYKPENGRWQLMIWDLNILLDAATTAWGAGLNLSTTMTGGETSLSAIYAHPPFRRMYLRALKELANGPMVDANVRPLVMAKHHAFLAHGVTPATPETTLTRVVTTAPPATGNAQDGIAIRRTAILNFLAAEDTAAFVVTGTNVINTTNNLVTISGSAPLQMATLRVNGIEYPLTWTSARNWTLRLAVSSSTNFVLQGYDRWGNPLAEFDDTITVNYTGPVPNPVGSVVINEIMYNPSVPNSSFVELYNTSSTTAFDLSGWRLNGLGYEFPAGSVISTGQVLVIAKNHQAFYSANANTIPVFDLFDGNIDLNGEILTLIKPGATPEQDLFVDRVRYEAGLPWPSSANGGGSSLQLMDSSVDNSRVSAWADGRDWKFFSFTGRPTTNLFMFYMTPSGGEVFIDDIHLAEGTEAGVGPNLIRNGGFEQPFGSDWNTNNNTRFSEIVNTTKHSGNASLALRFANVGGAFTLNFSQTNVPVNTNLTYTISFWYNYGTNGQNLRATMSGTSSLMNGLLSIRPIFSSAGARNTIAVPLPEYDPVWLNEVLVNNTTGTNDNVGEREPWIELYNGGATAINLSTYYLSDSYSNLTKWAFPAGTMLNPGHRIVWADGEAGETAGAHLHTSFDIGNSTAGSVVLSRLIGGAPQIVDYLNYNIPVPNTSYGDNPDGQPFTRQVFYSPTAARVNDAPAVTVFINEWMASNQLLQDPEGDTDDWFELFNGQTEPVDLSGYYLTDTTANKTQFRIPNGTIIPAMGYLMVWADGDGNHNVPNPDHLHASFNLSRTLDTIALYEPDGASLVDIISFTNQTENVSGGRFPDGTPNIYAFSPATPGSANTLGDNNPPTIAAISDKTITVGQTLSFTATANDPDAPPQSLSFSLTTAPAGATIGSISGLFSWTPSAPTTNTITVRVADNGGPSLSDSTSFTVRVYPKARAEAVVSGGNVQVTFGPTIQGRTYQIQYRDDLNDPNPNAWVNFGSPFVASASSTTINDAIGARPQRFYRMNQVD